MPSAASSANKRVKGVSVYRPFIFGSVAQKIDPADRPANIPAEHTHQWTVYVRPVPDSSLPPSAIEASLPRSKPALQSRYALSNSSSKTGTQPAPTDLQPWLKKVQFKLHETYPQSLRTIEAAPFQVSETGWGEFEVSLKLYFSELSHEKPQTVYHMLKLHPYAGTEEDRQRVREQNTEVRSEAFEEVLFVEPVERFYRVLTGEREEDVLKLGGGGGSGTAAASAAAAAANKKGGKASAKTMPPPPAPPSKKKGREDSSASSSPLGGGAYAEIPKRRTKENVFSIETELEELERMRAAVRQVKELETLERERIRAAEVRLLELRKTEPGVPPMAGLGDRGEKGGAVSVPPTPGSVTRARG